MKRRKDICTIQRTGSGKDAYDFKRLHEIKNDSIVAMRCRRGTTLAMT